MRIDRVIYGSTVPTVQFGNQRPGFEASLEPGEDPVEAYLKLHEIAMKAVEKVIGPPQVGVIFSDNQGRVTGGIMADTSTSVIDLSHEKMEIAIDNCKDEQELKAWKENNPIMPAPILKHYNTRMEILRIEKNNKIMGDKNQRQ